METAMGRKDKYFRTNSYDKSGQKVQELALAPESSAPANDALYSDLEARYGGGFAQWVIDGLDRRRKVV